MPFTPFHLGPGFAIGIIFKKHMNLAAVLLASIIVDIRAVYCLFIGNCPLHGLLHTFTGATFLSILVIFAIFISKNTLKKITDSLKIRQDYSLQSIIAGAVLGVWLHILLDAFLYKDMSPFWPFAGNGLYGIFGNSSVYSFCIAGFFIGAALYIKSTDSHRQPKKDDDQHNINIYSGNQNNTDDREKHRKNYRNREKDRSRT